MCEPLNHHKKTHSLHLVKDENGNLRNFTWVGDRWDHLSVADAKIQGWVYVCPYPTLEEVAAHQARVTELLEANNREVEAHRETKVKLREIQAQNLTPKTEIDEILARVKAEIFAATAMWPPFNSQHEGFAVLREELEELADETEALWAAVKINQKKRDLTYSKETAMKVAAEAVQVAAMAVRFANEVCDEQRGRK